VPEARQAHIEHCPDLVKGRILGLPEVLGDNPALRRSARQSLSFSDRHCRWIARSEHGGHFSFYALVTRVRYGLSMG